MPSFLTGYTKRKKITIDKTYVDSDQSNFRLYVPFTNDADIGADIDSDGYNIRFTDSDGTTLLNYERQSFSVNGSNQATGKFWVKVPTVYSATNTDIYIYSHTQKYSDKHAYKHSINTHCSGRQWDHTFQFACNAQQYYCQR